MDNNQAAGEAPLAAGFEAGNQYVLTVHDFLPKPGLDGFEAAPGFGEGQPGPLREILHGGGSPAHEITPREFSQRLLARQGPGMRGALVQQRIGELFPAPRAAAHDAFQFRVHHEIGQPDAVIGRNAGFLEHARAARRESVACRLAGPWPGRRRSA